MQSYTPLQLSEQENFDIDESHVLRYGPSGISFHNRDHDLSNYVHSTVPTATNAFWLDKKQQLLVQSESHELHLLDINAKLLMETEPLGAEVKEVGVIDVVDEDGVKGVVSTILLARTDEHLMVISLKNKKQLCLIQVKFRNLQDLVFTNDYSHIGIRSSQGFTLYGLDGTKAVTFKRLDFSPKGVRLLQNGSWLTAAIDSSVQWWGSEGEEIARFPWPVRLDSGVRLLESGSLLCTNDETVVFEINAKGKVAAIYKDYDWSQKDFVRSIAKGLSSTFIALSKVENLSVTKQRLTRFKHHINAIGKYVDQVDVDDEDGNIVKGASPKRKVIGNQRVWNFFYRPDEKTLRNQLVDEMRAISKVDDALVNEETTIRKTQGEKKSSSSIRGVLSIFFALSILACIGGAVWGFILSGVVWGDWHNYEISDAELMSMLGMPVIAPLIGIGIFGLLFLIVYPGFRKVKRHSREISEALTILDLIKVQTLNLKDKVKTYRAILLKQLPKIGDDRPSDSEMSEHVQALLSGKIRQIALDECGLDESDINSVDADGNEIRTYINEPGYLQLINDNDVPRAINPENLYSFYLGPDNKPIFAVQFIQYFFLGTNKIDAFTCFYDFINDETIANESHTFYYRDVTNIGKRQVDFSDVVSNESLDNAKLGVEMKLVVASGDTIRINIATDETYRMMNKEVQDHAERELNTRTCSIKDEIRQIEQSTDISDEEKAEEIEDLQETLAQVEVEFCRRIDEHVSTHTETSQQIIQHVRGRLKELKEI